MERYKKINIIIAVLAVLLVISLAALCVTLIHNRNANKAEATAAVQDNIITPDSASDAAVGSTDDVDLLPTEAAQSALPNKSSDENALSIELYNKQPSDNTAFKLNNMLPGDTETRCCRVAVSYHDKITLHFKSEIKSGDKELGDALNIKVVLPDYGETLYDGPINKMPDSLTHKLVSKEAVTDEIYYEITSYLPTDAGNEYQNKSLVADFNWWAGEPENLDNSPKTGEETNIVLLTMLAVCLGAALICFLIAYRRKRKGDYADV